MRDATQSLLALNAPGSEQALLRYIVAADDTFPAIEMHGWAAWQREHAEAGYLRQYVERVRTFYRTGEDLGVTYLACPLCPLELCGTGLDTPAALSASRAHAYAHLMAYRTQRQAAEPDHPAHILLAAGAARDDVED